MAATPAERKQKERQTKLDAGYVWFGVWTTPERAKLLTKIMQLHYSHDIIKFLTHQFKDQI